MTLKVFEAFAGVGSQRMALRNLGIEHEVVAIAEIDRFAIASYEAIHGKTLNLGDISQIPTEYIPDHDLFTYSFPCQDISVAGKQAGLDMDSGTRSGLLWECQKVIAAKKPKYLLLENVKNLVGKRHKANFDLWLEWLVEQGYSNYWKVLNSKDFGVPQNRERVFVVSILGDHEPFEFPEKQELTTRLKDLLVSNVEEKYYLPAEKVEKLLAKMPKPEALVWDQSQMCRDNGARGVRGYTDYAPCLSAREYKDPRLVNESASILQIGNIVETGNWNNPQRGRVYSQEGISPALNTVGGGGLEPKVLINNATKQGYLEATEGDGIDLAYPDSSTRRGRVQKECSPTPQTGDTVGTVEFASTDMFRVRKLTPLECWRLMGFTDADFFKAQAVNSNSQLYKQAGNSIVVPVLEAIFSQLFNVNTEELQEVA